MKYWSPAKETEANVNSSEYALFTQSHHAWSVKIVLWSVKSQGIVFLSWWVATLNKHHVIPLTTLGPLLCVWTLQYCYITHIVCFKVFTWNLLTCQHVLSTMWSGFVCSASQHPKSTVKKKKAHKPLCILWISPKTCLSRLVIIQSCYYSGQEAPSHKMG